MGYSLHRISGHGDSSKDVDEKVRGTSWCLYNLFLHGIRLMPVRSEDTCRVTFEGIWCRNSLSMMNTLSGDGRYRSPRRLKGVAVVEACVLVMDVKLANNFFLMEKNSGWPSVNCKNLPKY